MPDEATLPYDENGHVSESSGTQSIGTGDPMPPFEIGTASPPPGYEPSITVPTTLPEWNVQPQAEVFPPIAEAPPPPSTSQLVDQVMTDVETIKNLKLTLATTIDRVRAVQKTLAVSGVILNFPVLDEVTLGGPGTPGGPAGSHMVIAQAVIPPLSDEEVRNAPMELNEDINAGAPAVVAPPDRRDEAQVARDSFINPNQGEVDQFQMAVEKGYESAVQRAFTDAEKAVARENAKVMRGSGGTGWMNPFNNV